MEQKVADEVLRTVICAAATFVLCEAHEKAAALLRARVGADSPASGKEVDEAVVLIWNRLERAGGRVRSLDVRGLPPAAEAVLRALERAAAAGLAAARGGGASTPPPGWASCDLVDLAAARARDVLAYEGEGERFSIKGGTLVCVGSAGGPAFAETRWRLETLAGVAEQFPCRAHWDGEQEWVEYLGPACETVQSVAVGATSRLLRRGAEADPAAGDAGGAGPPAAGEPGV
jgi:hypothetical protein